MQKRFLPFISTFGVILMIAGLMAVFARDTDESTLSEVTTGTPTFVPVAGAGTVILLRTDSQLEIKSVFPYKGYTYETLVSSGSSVEVLFRGEGREVLFTASIDGEGIKVETKVSDEDLIGGILAAATSSSTAPVLTTGSAASTTSPAPPAAVITTAPPRTTTTTRAPTTTVATTVATTAPPTTPPPTTMTLPPPTTTTTLAPTTTTTLAPTTTTIVPSIPDGDVTYPMGPAGTITVTFLAQQFVDAALDLKNGWNVDETELDSDRIRIELSRGDQKTIWEANIVDGEVIVELRTNKDD